MLYITDMLDFTKWTEGELDIINIVFNEKLTKREYLFIQHCYKHPCETRKNNARTFNKEKGGTPFNSYNLFELKLKPALKKELKRQGIKRDF